jgi:hypothetical protein
MDNYILGNGRQAPVEQKRGIRQHLPAWMYHKDFQARIIHTQAELEKAKAEGWVDSPAKVTFPVPETTQSEIMGSFAVLEETKPEETVETKPEVEAVPEVFACDQCGKAFDKKQALAMHKLSHRTKV